jgi:esterase/lipase superfamily enzyme
MRRLAAMLALILSLSGCISGIKYGDVPHAAFVADPRCNPQNADVTDMSDKPLFAVTSRLPDCRSGNVLLTNFRSDKLRYARFAAPAGRAFVKGRAAKGRATKSGAGKGRAADIVPLNIEPETRWWDDLAKQTISNDGRLLVYVHGFRETFYTSSRDTAQIGRLTEYKGPIVQYSWPSEGKLLSYGVDETNMNWDRLNFQNFLQILAEKPWVKDIILVSHSMGVRLVIPSIQHVDANAARPDSSNISNIILLSPDADRQEFERDLGLSILSPRFVAAGRKLSVFVSAKDSALGVSRTIHGYPRLGNPYCFDPFAAAALIRKGLPERCYPTGFSNAGFLDNAALRIIDTTDVSAGRSGHSDYLRSAAVCQEFARLVKGEAMTGLVPTYLPYVFTLRPYAKDEKPEHNVICRRPTDKR